MSDGNTRLARGFALLFFLLTCPLEAAPVERAAAYQVAAGQLPVYYAGPWQLSDEYVLEDLSGARVAYTFIFSRPVKQAASASDVQAVAPTSFVARARTRLTGEGKTVTGNTPELYGDALFASIMISADDTEPPVLRCFRGLPPELVKEEDALALAAQKRNGGAWRVSRRLMLGMFDEAFCLENAADTNAVVVVEMRSRSVATKTEAQARRPRKQTGTDDAERMLMCRAAWRGLGVVTTNAAIRTP